MGGFNLIRGLRWIKFHLIEISNLEYTIECKGNKSVHVKGARQAQNQRRATMQACLRVKGPQVVPLVLSILQIS